MKAFVEHRDKKRKARGFSVPEVVEAGLTWVDCARMKLPLDPKRRTSYKDNVAQLKEAAKNKPAPKPKAKKVKTKTVPKK